MSTLYYTASIHYPPLPWLKAATAAAAASSSTTTSISNPRTDGTFQTGAIRNGELEMDPVAGQFFSAVNGATANATANGTNGTTGGGLSGEELRRGLDLRLNESSGA
ncbi:hypothetical protein F503_04870 [Ophiostoma piceae UAMH 11346]|uniref:Uncharacterized protein n=1 Tax=Ophiostoma piceae (strain UAMH 11346) TaxID=1262450 RepID=S3BU52_OPHP1|nr:hypothetical protein F503_04870 [Ophiostoma piceae UAMH 11346]